jgi:transcriptional regulator with XRE-family HTH domain
MATDKLRAALQNAGLRTEELADIVQVDVRTVRRWLSGGAPYARHRAKVARALDTTEQHLWPEIPQPVITDSLAAHTQPDDSDAPTIEGLIRVATQRVDLLDNTTARLLASAGLPELVLAKASQGCHVRILVTTPDVSLKPLVGHQQIEIKAFPAPVGQVIHRVDDQMLIALSLDSEHDQRPPILHVREHRAPGLFSRLERHYENTWRRASEEIKTDHDLDNYVREHDPSAGLSDGNRDTAAHEQDGSTAAVGRTTEAPPRRWPRRPE